MRPHQQGLLAAKLFYIPQAMILTVFEDIGCAEGLVEPMDGRTKTSNRQRV
jgi:hypothetical protein